MRSQNPTQRTKFGVIASQFAEMPEAQNQIAALDREDTKGDVV